MAYPDYSIVVVDVTTDGITEPVVFVHFDEQVSKKYFKDAILGGHRAFYYEKPKPNDFNRNDTQPIINATAGEAALLSSSSVLAFTKDPVADAKVDEWIENLERTWTVLDESFNAIQSGSYHAGERIGEKFFNALNNFYYNKFAPWAYQPRGGLIESITVGNKTYNVRYSGSYDWYVETINNCPAVGTVLSTATNVPYTQLTTIGGIEITLGTYNETVTADGNCEATSDRTYTWASAGTILGQRLTEEQLVVYFKSNGNGWYYEELAQAGGGGGGGGGDLPNCDPYGIELNPENRTDGIPMYWYIDEEQYQIGTKVGIYITDGQCGEIASTLDNWLSNGTEILVKVSDDGYVTTTYTSDGNGGVNTSIDDQTPPPPPVDPDPHEDYEGYCANHPSDPICQCPAEGATVDWLGVPFPELTEPRNLTYNGTSQFENAGTDYYDQVANGNCGFSRVESSLTTEWNVEADSVIGSDVSEETLNTDGGTVWCFQTNGGVVPVSIQAVVLAANPTPQSGRVTTNPNQTEYPFISGAGTPLTQHEIEVNKYSEGDYRLNENGSFVWGQYAPRNLWNVFEGDILTNSGFWTAADKSYALQHGEMQSQKAKRPDTHPFNNTLPTLERNKKVNSDLITIPYITGVIYKGRQVCKKAYGIGTNPNELRWYYEEVLIEAGHLPRSSRWEAPSASRMSAQFLRMGINSSGLGQSSIESYLPPNMACCPMFNESFFPFIQWAGSSPPIPAPDTIDCYKENGKILVGTGAYNVLYAGYHATVQCNGRGGLKITVNTVPFAQ